ncbi:MAG: phosphatidic acid phosphatase [Oscillospiraceae bacterium]|nr:phosphatidic acid phosphatase [Oscillospiraceae bacterium]
MKKPVVDYRDFRFSKLGQPEFSHLKLLLGWVGYFILYFLTERFIPAERCYVVHCALDDKIPFCEAFLIPYVFWYLLVAGSLLYFALYSPESFRKLMTYIIVTQIVAMTVYILFPNRQDLRPAVFPRDNILTKGVAFLYSFDTNTNVCPSLHVGYSLGIASVWLKEKTASRGAKVFVLITVIFVCMSVSFIKQHSVVDIFAALPMCLLAEFIAFHWPKRKKTA